jgi:hypothetical protein
MKRWDAVIVYWIDSSGGSRWTDIQNIIDYDSVACCWTVGFFVGYNDECIKIVSNASDNDTVDHYMYIPKVAIKKIQILQEADE